MITALYNWAKYKAKKDNLLYSPMDFINVIRKLIIGDIEVTGLYSLYEPIAHLYETYPFENPNYQFKIIDKSKKERDVSQEEMKYLMIPKRGLTGKAKQSIGGSIYARTTLKNAVIITGGKYEKVREGKNIIHRVVISKNKLIDFWRQRLLDTYFQSRGEFIGEERICPFCGIKHEFKNLRFNPPINIFVENVTNYNPYLYEEPSHSICPYCAMLFLRTVLEEKGPEKIQFPKAKNAFIYNLPYEPENEYIYEIFNKNKAGEFLKKEIEDMGWRYSEIDALYYLLYLPLFIFRSLPLSLSGRIKPYVYIVFASISKQAEEISNHFVITRFDYLAKVGEMINEEGGVREIYNFKSRLNSFIEKFKKDQVVIGYKLIFRFLGKMLSEGNIDFIFLHSLLRKEINQKKKDNKIPYFTGYKYLNAFLKAKREV